jgi:hypothetical protein
MEWIKVTDKTPDLLPDKDYSENVLAVCDGNLHVMIYGYVEDGEQGGWVWSDCYGDINGEGEWDDDYQPTHWMPLPKPPHIS